MTDPLLLTGAGISLFVFGVLVGITLERTAGPDRDDLTDWDDGGQ